MDALRIAGRIYDNLRWSAAFDPTGARAPADVWAQIEALWGEPGETFVAFLYPCLLGRPADEVGLSALCALLAAGAPRSAVVRRLARSEEARASGLDLSWLPRLDALEAEAVWRRVRALYELADVPFVEGLYPALLGRPADAVGRSAFRALLREGALRSTVVRRVALSEEARGLGLDVSWLPRLGSLEGDAVWRRIEALWRTSRRAFVRGLYAVLLSRQADAAALSAYCAALAAGAPRSAVVRRLALSEEARGLGLDVSWLPRLAALEGDALWRRVEALWGASDRRFVEGVYLALLGRTADAVAVRGHCAALAAGGPRFEVVRRVALSEEARAFGLDVSWLPRLAALTAGARPPLLHLLSPRRLLQRWRAGWKGKARGAAPEADASARPVPAAETRRAA
jgi:uncharacterized protein DUF4214